MSLRILHVDPDEEILHSFQRYLKLCGFRVATATSEPECAEQLQIDVPDVLVLEPALPNDEGPKILSLCNDAEGRMTFPVIALSRRGPHHIPFRFHEYHVKPIPLSTLADSIRSVHENGPSLSQ